LLLDDLAILQTSTANITEMNSQFRALRCYFKRTGTGVVELFGVNVATTTLRNVRFVECTFRDEDQTAVSGTTYAFLKIRSTCLVDQFQMRNCRALMNTVTPNAGMAILNVGRDVVFADCTFLNETTAVGAAIAIYDVPVWLTLKAASLGEFGRYARSVARCTFVGTSLAAGFVNHDGLFVGNLGDTLIEDCTFLRLGRGCVLVSSTEVPRFLFKTCTFQNETDNVAAQVSGGVAYAIATDVFGPFIDAGFTNYKHLIIEGCNFHTASILFGASNAVLDGHVVRDSSFVKARHILSCLALVNFAFENNSVQDIAAPLSYTMQATLGECRASKINGCTFTNIAADNSSGVLGSYCALVVRSPLLANFVMSDCLFDNVQNGAYDFIYPAAIVLLECNALENVMLKTNQATRVTNARTNTLGTAVEPTAFVCVSSYVPGTIFIRDLKLADNSIGDRTSHVTLLRNYGTYADVEITLLTISGNTFVTAVGPTVAGGYVARDIIRIGTTGGKAHSVYKVDGNVFSIIQNLITVSDAFDLISFDVNTAHADTYDCVSIHNNVVNKNPTTFPPFGLTTRGIMYRADIEGFSFRNNHLNNAGSTIAFRGAVYASGGSMTGSAQQQDPVLPVPGSLMSDNIGWWYY
jgi:hypothetical protein